MAGLSGSFMVAWWMGRALSNKYRGVPALCITPPTVGTLILCYAE